MKRHAAAETHFNVKENGQYCNINNCQFKEASVGFSLEI
jgi:hypothetical protein